MSAVFNLLKFVDMITFDSKEGLVCMNQELDELISVLSNFSANGMFDLVELAFPAKSALPDKSVIAVLEHSRSTFKSLSALSSTIRDQLEIILGY
nr:MAG TPA: hypothetical protein [Microviridae sp.]